MKTECFNLRIIDELNGKQFRGQKLKAAVVGEVNASMYKPTKAVPVNEQKQFKTKMHADAESDSKPSILSRIKKNH